MTVFGGGAAYGINDSGTVVGQTVGGQAFIIGPSGTTFFASNSAALGINDSGTVVGFATVGSGTIQPVSYSDGSLAYLGSPGISPMARAINDGGTTVGTDNTQHAVIFSGSTTVDLSPYLATVGLTGISVAMAINANGDIVGTGVTAGGDREAFLLKVVPEPSTGILLILGLLGWSALRRIKK
jgi:hypothetical protein